MKNTNLAVITISLIFLSALTALNIKAQIPASGRLMTVNDTGDSNDINIGDNVCLDANGKCTLRAAIQEANNCCGFNVVNFELPAGSVINLTLGELLITKTLHIIGPGARRLTIQRSSTSGTPNFRIFHIAANSANNMIIRGFKVAHGNTDGDGGAFYIERNNILRITEIAVVSNSARQGGGIANAGTLFLTRSLFTSNNAAGSNGAGGAFVNLNGASATISNSTLLNNASNNGGAIYNNENLLLVNNTITQNSADTSGSNIFNTTNGTINILNTIVGASASSTVSSLSGAFNSLGTNIITDSRSSTGFVNGTNGDQISTNNSINPLLGTLADNGGQTDTLALLPNSPAIDRGNNCVTSGNCAAPVTPGFRLSYDQRTAFTRLVGGTVDIGAFEFQSRTFSGSLSYGTFSNNRFLSGSIVILTIASTGEKRYAVVRPSGGFSFSNLPFGEVFIQEIRSKRAGLSSVTILDFELPIAFPLSPSFEIDGLRISFDKK